MKRPISNRLGMYDDVRSILDTALRSGGGTFVLPTYGSAVHWRQRAYKFRKLYAQTIADSNALATSQYDKLTLPQIDFSGEKDEPHTVVIKVREIIGTFTPAREPYVSNVNDEDELFDVAKAVADKITKGGR